MDLINKQVSALVAEKINGILITKGIPSPGRLLIISPIGEQQTQSGIFIPGNTDDKELPRKGVVIQYNKLEQVANEISTGVIITYGMYAGKEINFDPNLFPFLDMKAYKFTILSESEVIYIESNN